MLRLQLRALVLQVGEFVGSLLQHALEKLDLFCGRLGFNLVSITSDFFFELLGVFAQLFVSYGSLGDMLGNH